MSGGFRTLRRRTVWAAIILCRRLLRRDPVTGIRIHRVPLREFGEGPGKWRVPARAVCTPGARVLSAGVGLDATFDLALAEAGAEVVMLDPTPGVREYAEAVASGRSGLRFWPVGVWETPGPRLFHAPRRADHISHSITALQGERPAFTAECRTLEELTDDLGWDRLELLKLDIEGAEYAVLDRWLAQPRPPLRALCVEFDETHTPQDPLWRARIRARTKRLQAAGFRLVGVAGKGNYTFLQPREGGNGTGGEAPGDPLASRDCGTRTEHDL